MKKLTLSLILFLFLGQMSALWAQDRPPLVRLGPQLGIGFGLQAGNAFEQLPFDTSTSASTAHFGLAVDLGLTRNIILNLWPSIATANYGSLVFVPHNIRTTSLRLPFGFTFNDEDVGMKFGAFYHHILSSVLKPESDAVTSRIELNEDDRAVAHDFGYYVGITFGGFEVVNHDILLMFEPDVFDFVFAGLVYNVSFKVSL